jgi:DNA-binding transcriptional MerR regulator
MRRTDPSRARQPGPSRTRRDADPEAERFAVGDVARIARVSVRTLHHYDTLGILRPAGREDNGYRWYVREDLERLQRILAYRELGFELAAIGELLDDPATDRLEHLRRQATLLDARMERLQKMRSSLYKTMEALQMGIDLDPKEMFEVFGEFDPTEHAAEAEERWGDTDAYRQSRERTKRYDKDQWQRIAQTSDAIEARFAAALAAGEPPDGSVAMDAAEAHRQHIGRWFYDCSSAMHVGLADMYEADPRFTKHYEDRAPGLARYVAAAIRANADRR